MTNFVDAFGCDESSGIRHGHCFGFDRAGQHCDVAGCGYGGDHTGDGTSCKIDDAVEVWLLPAPTDHLGASI